MVLHVSLQNNISEKYVLAMSDSDLNTIYLVLDPEDVGPADNVTSTEHVLEKVNLSQFVDKFNSSETDQYEKVEGKYVCPVEFCEASFDKEASLYGHLNTHKNLKLGCKVEGCDQSFSSFTLLRKHSLLHSGSTHPYECAQCGLKFDRYSQMKYHIERKHENVVKFKCHICDKGFYKESDMKSHFACHSGVKQYSCEVCSKSFSHISNFNRHKRIHTNEKPYVCKECGKRFNQTSALNNHARIHTTHIFGQCPKCPKKFKTGRVLLQHLKAIHGYSKENLKNVSRNSVLFSHRKYLDLIAPADNKEKASRQYYCKVCGNQFPFIAELRSHEKEQHKDYDHSLFKPETVTEEKQEITDIINTLSPAFDRKSSVTVDQDPALQLSSKPPAAVMETINNLLSSSPVVEEPISFTVGQIIRSYTDLVPPPSASPLRRAPAPQVSETQVIIVQNPEPQLWDDGAEETTTFELVLDDKMDSKGESVAEDNTGGINIEYDLPEGQVEGKHVCQVCKKTFSKKHNLQSHMGLHNEEDRKFYCSHCGESFAWKSSLNRHIERNHVNSGVEFGCSWCDKTYKVQSVLNDHVKRDHFNERKHKCDICYKTFFKAYDLNYHKRLHLAIKPYECR